MNKRIQMYKNQVKYLQEELRYCRRLCYREQQEIEQLKTEVGILTFLKNKFRGYELPEAGMKEVF